MDGLQLLEALPVAVYMTNADGHITYYNQAAAELRGHRPELGTSRWCGSWRLFWPDGRPLPHDECPMALTLKGGRAVRGIEAIAERPDGTRVRFLPYPTPLHDASGRLTGAINLLMDVTERYQTDIDASRLASIVTSSDDAIVTKTLDSRITSWNEGATRIFGYTAEEMIGESITRIIPPELHPEEQQILARLKRGEHIRHYETVRVAKDGRRLDISVTVSPLRDKFGTIVGASKIARDITERKQAESLQRLLFDELNHRVKNTLAMIQAIATQSLHRARTPSDFVSSFIGRVQSLALAHNTLIKSNMQGAEIKELVHEQVLLGGIDDNRISISGPMLVLDTQSAVHLALVLHELATNARKYGALSVATGRLVIKWEVQSSGGPKLLLDWKESNGPKVSAPKEHGFGSTLIEKTLQSHGGEVSVRYEEEGVSSQIRMPLNPTRPVIGPHMSAARIQTAPMSLQPDNQSKVKGKKIIVIEDEPLVAMDLESNLIAAGCELAGSVGTLDRAKILIANTECDAALVDVNLAGQPVDELAAALTKRNIPFAFVTGYGKEALPSGFGDTMILNKPFSQEQLRATLEHLLHFPANVVPLRQKK